MSRTGGRQRSPRLRKALAVASSLGVLLAGSVSAPARASTGPEWLPLKGDYKNAVGCTWYNGCAGGYHGYPAVDFEVPYGTPVYAAGDGALTAYIGCDANGGPEDCGPDNFGNAVKITHPSGRDSWYGHLSRVAKRSGSVRTGQLIGWTGRSGQSHNTHLHYEERPTGGGWGTQVDPGPMIALDEGRRVTYPNVLGSASWQLPCGKQPGERCDERHRIRNDRFAALPEGAKFYGDWDGDGTVTLGVARRTARGLEWHLRNRVTSGPADRIFVYGAASDTPIVGDWDGEGGDSIGVVRRANGRSVWFLRNRLTSGPTERVFTYGLASDIPVVGNWDGDDGDGIGVVRRTAGRAVWILRNRTSPARSDRIFAYGLASDTPLVGNWDGDGGDSIGIARGTATGRLQWHLRNRNAPGRVDRVLAYGLASDIPVVGNWDGKRGDTVGIARRTAPGGLQWHLRNRNATGPAHAVLNYGLASDAL